MLFIFLLFSLLPNVKVSLQMFIICSSIFIPVFYVSLSLGHCCIFIYEKQISYFFGVKAVERQSLLIYYIVDNLFYF